MTVDFHTHIFPVKIAAGAVASLAAACHIPAHSDGTAAGLLAGLERAGVDVAVNLPVLTKPSQFESVLHFSEAGNARFHATGRGILSFGGAHPAIVDQRAAMRAVREAGLLGVKLHPEYQDSFIDSDDCYRLLAAAKEEGLIVVTHAGVDGAYRDRPVRATPERIARVLDRLGGYSRLVLAHLGGNELQEEVLTHLAGRDVYLDTAYVLPATSPAYFRALIDRHGAERILFATDSPWQDIAAERARLATLGLTPAEEEAIACRNACALLGIPCR